VQFNLGDITWNAKAPTWDGRDVQAVGSEALELGHPGQSCQWYTTCAACTACPTARAAAATAAAAAATALTAKQVELLKLGQTSQQLRAGQQAVVELQAAQPAPAGG
jgi:hypothetical protein